MITPEFIEIDGNNIDSIECWNYPIVGNFMESVKKRKQKRNKMFDDTNIFLRSFGFFYLLALEISLAFSVLIGVILIKTNEYLLL